jgi:hypothetical protein
MKTLLTIQISFATLLVVLIFHFDRPFTFVEQRPIFVKSTACITKLCNAKRTHLHLANPLNYAVVKKKSPLN